MKVISTLVLILTVAITATAQQGAIFRLVPDDGQNLGGTITVGSTTNTTISTSGGFLRNTIWRRVVNGVVGTTPESPASGATLQIFGYTLEINNISVDLSAFTFNIQIRSEFRDLDRGNPRLRRGRIRINNNSDNTTRTLALGNNSTITLGWGTGTVGTTVYYCPGYLRLSAEGDNRIARITSRYLNTATPPVFTETTIATVTNGNRILNAHAFRVTTNSTSDAGWLTATSDDADNGNRTIILTNAAPPSANITNRSVARPGGAYFPAFPLFYAAGAAPGGAVTPLPMRLGDFTATRQSQGTVLRWSTVQEVNSDNFEIQQSTNAQNWKTIGTVKAAGSSGSVLNYQFEDNSVNSGVVYYRLKMNDLDTKFEYSSVARIQWGAGSKKLFAYPSPATTYTTISTDVAIDGAVTVLIYEMTTGRMVQQKVVNAAGNNFRLGLEGLQTGTYTVQLIKQGEILGRVNLVKQ